MSILKRSEDKRPREKLKQRSAEALADTNLLTKPQVVQDYLLWHLGNQQTETFCAIFISTQNHALAHIEE